MTCVFLLSDFQWIYLMGLGRSMVMIVSYCENPRMLKFLLFLGVFTGEQ